MSFGEPLGTDNDADASSDIPTFHDDHAGFDGSVTSIDMLRHFIENL
jgi:hypothetical protein